ncbi:hypothetical protein [Paenibacillus sp. USDA918EY]|uniref:hypothetical protein n=1 Tax=Paenibacillus sp. USDA918EY TaxID=2689575 RepID=UPI003FA70A83
MNLKEAVFIHVAPSFPCSRFIFPQLYLREESCRRWLCMQQGFTRNIKKNKPIPLIIKDRARQMNEQIQLMMDWIEAN